MEPRAFRFYTPDGLFRERCIAARCRVEFQRLDRRVVAETEDLTVRGVFVRTEEVLPVGAVVNLRITLPDERRVQVVSRACHFLSPPVADALGRATGIGFSFLEQEGAGRQRLAAYLEARGEKQQRTASLPEGAYILAADPDEEMRKRLVNALSEAAGLSVVAVASGAEAGAAFQESAPHAVVAAAESGAVDGFALLAAIRAEPRFANVPVILTSGSAGDLDRLRAYRLGVTDFMPRPFTDEELAIRLGRALAGPREASRPVLQGSLSQVPIATLLTLCEFESKSGILVLRRRDARARLFIASGRVVRIEGPAANAGPRHRLLQVLDWTEGQFELHPCEVIGTDDVQLQTAQLLLEYARVRDEERRRGSAPDEESREGA